MQFSGRASSFLKTLLQVALIRLFGMAFILYLEFISFLSRSNLTFIKLIHLFIISLIVTAALSLWIPHSHLSFHIKYADLAVRMWYSLFVPTSDFFSLLLMVTAELARIVPSVGFRCFPLFFLPEIFG